MRIYLDPASIHAEIEKRHPEIKKGVVALNTSNSPAWATFHDQTGCENGPVDIAWDETFVEDYHGFAIEVVRWHSVSADHWSAKP